MDVLEHLLAARALIAAPDGFCQHSLSRQSGTRIQFCSIGALMQVDTVSCWYEIAAVAPLSDVIRASYPDCPLARPAIGPIQSEEGFNWALVVGFNNSHTQDEVVAVFDAAIENERAKRRDLVGLLCTPALPLPGELELAPCP